MAAAATAAPLSRVPIGSKGTTPTTAQRQDKEQALICPKCGTICSEGLAQDAQRRIAELESQVRILTDKATAAVDKLADYEDELRMLKGSQSQQSATGFLAGNPPSTPPASSTDIKFLSPNTAQSPSSSPSAKPAAAPTTGSRIAAFLGRTSPAPAAAPANSSPSLSAAGPGDIPPPSPTRRESDLEARLQKEQAARQQAESKADKLSGEMEDLSAQLFQQANEMVSAERKARARLEERVEVLEKRDVEKRKRLERLEGALKRIERVRGVLGGPG